MGPRAGEDTGTKEKSLSLLGIEHKLCSPLVATILTASQSNETELKGKPRDEFVTIPKRQ